jgi:Na+-transporting NADH:ubiquinone oxidoreductase subunit NqrB
MQQKTLALDPRYFQVLFQLIFLAYGLLFLSWLPNWSHYFISICGCLFFNYVFESSKQKKFLSLFGSKGFKLWGFSVLISAASLCLLLKTNHWSVSLLATLLTVASKYLFRYHHKHIFNPSAFGIIATIVLTRDAWLSPAQWGSNAVIFFFVVTLGVIVVTRVQKLDVSLAFLLTFIGLLFWRQVYVLGWPMDHFVHSVSTGSLLLFTFFMISDPRTAPDHPRARIIWAFLIAAVSFYLAAFRWMNNTPLWVLVVAAPLVPVLDKIFKAEIFQWKEERLPSFSFTRRFAHPLTRKIVASFLLVTMMTQQAAAFCGFYVSKADGALKNKTSQVIMVRDGDRNVITMYNDFKGKFKDFAMVVPVPVVLEKKDIKVVSQQIFTTLNDYSKPRLVEYYDRNPCQQEYLEDATVSKALQGSVSGVRIRGYGALKEEKVKIEAQYIVGEYDILILSATESAALKTWLNENDYKIPKGAEEVLEPYIKSNLKFFVVKVNEEEKKKLPGDFLRPIQISFTSPKFMLPIRLGMANADGDQDMIVYAFTKKGRTEVTNYRTVSMPTGKNIPLFVKNNFGSFYTNLFQHQWKREGKAVALLEYAWDVSPRNFMKCDPCVATAPSQQDLVQAGVWWMDPASVKAAYTESVYFTRLHVRYNRSSFPQDLTFQVTPNTDNYQARYIVTHPAQGDFSCDAGKQYLKELKQRRTDEMEMLTYLTGRNYNDWDLDASEENAFVPTEASYENVAKTVGKDGANPVVYALASFAGLVLFLRFRKRKVKEE